ncbi:MAG: hypothetical protein DWQ06_16335 [Calditrichaeota bacterium]|nr:MAG: hypothetical protein DWQ06_16335 [Calditrichota bacterium]
MLNKLQEVFKYFQKHNVKYVTIGGIAAVLHGVPRATFDLDILIEATPENVQNLLDALIEANFGTATMTNVENILKNEITVFQDKVRIDVQTSTPGLTFEIGWKNKKIMKYGKQEFYVVSLDDLIDSKSAAKRKIDLEDVQLLKQRKAKK